MSTYKLLRIILVCTHGIQEDPVFTITRDLGTLVSGIWALALPAVHSPAVPAKWTRVPAQLKANKMAFKLRCELHGHEQDVRGCSSTPDGTIITCSRDTTVRLFSTVIDPCFRYKVDNLIQRFCQVNN